VVVSLVALTGCGSGPERPAAKPPGETSPPRVAAKPPGEVSPARVGRTPGVVTMIGDSLAVGTEALLPAALPGWTVHTDARRGRPIREGLDVLSRASVPRGSVLAFSLFTNDLPASTPTLQTALRAGASAVGPKGCQVWATIARPPVGGDASEPANDVLRRLDGKRVMGTRTVAADWAALVAIEPSLLGPDRVHGTLEGYRARAALYAQAVRRC